MSPEIPPPREENPENSSTTQQLTKLLMSIDSEDALVVKERAQVQRTLRERFERNPDGVLTALIMFLDMHAESEKYDAIEKLFRDVLMLDENKIRELSHSESEKVRHIAVRLSRIFDLKETITVWSKSQKIDALGLPNEIGTRCMLTVNNTLGQVPKGRYTIVRRENGYVFDEDSPKPGERPLIMPRDQVEVKAIPADIPMTEKEVETIREMLTGSLEEGAELLQEYLQRSEETIPDFESFRTEIGFTPDILKELFDLRPNLAVTSMFALQMKPMSETARTSVIGQYNGAVPTRIATDNEASKQVHQILPPGRTYVFHDKGSGAGTWKVAIWNGKTYVDAKDNKTQIRFGAGDAFYDVAQPINRSKTHDRATYQKRIESRDFPKVLKSGDIVFITGKTSAGPGIQAGSDSPFSHVGIVIEKEGGGFDVIYESVGYTITTASFANFRSKAVGGDLTICRPTGADGADMEAHVKRVISLCATDPKFAQKYRYDTAFNGMYCSKWVQEVLHAGRPMFVKYGKTEKKGSLNLESPVAQELLVKIMGKQLGSISSTITGKDIKRIPGIGLGIKIADSDSLVDVIKKCLTRDKTMNGFLRSPEWVALSAYMIRKNPASAKKITAFVAYANSGLITPGSLFTDGDTALLYSDHAREAIQP